MREGRRVGSAALRIWRVCSLMEQNVVDCLVMAKAAIEVHFPLPSPSLPSLSLSLPLPMPHFPFHAPFRHVQCRPDTCLRDRSLAYAIISASVRSAHARF
eukprot:3050554-Rhodomonas_salina.1